MFADGLREATTGTTKGRLQPWLVGLAAVAGFLLFVFVVLITKRLIYGRDEYVWTIVIHYHLKARIQIVQFLYCTITALFNKSFYWHSGLQYR